MNLLFIVLLSLIEVFLLVIFLIVMFEDVVSTISFFGQSQENENGMFRQFVTQVLGLGEQGENSKYSVLRVLGFGMGGILLALQAAIANRRAKAMQDTARTHLM